MRGPVLVACVLVPVLSCAPAAGASVPDVAPVAGWAGAAGVRVADRLALAGGAAHEVRLPGEPWALSLTVHLPASSALRVSAGGRLVAELRPTRDGGLLVHARATTRVPARAVALPRIHRVELLGGGGEARLSIDGKALPVARIDAPLRLRNAGSRPLLIEFLTVTPAARRDALLLHRVADIHARTPPGRFPLGEDATGRLRFDGGWTSGFWPGALWQASRLVPKAPYGDWALSASTARMGRERTAIHDVGFMFGRSVAAAHERLCESRAAARSGRCRVLRRSGLAAAETLVRLARTSTTGMIPTDPKGTEAQTIVDSLMNLGLLTWASRVSSERRYSNLARTHARRLTALLLRADGSTIQVAVHDRASGRLLRRGTRQGLTDDSTWARGQAWAIHGLADAAGAMRDRTLAGAAERAGAYWLATAPAAGIPPYDLSAGPSAPRDSSAAAIAAAGMYSLARACSRLPGTCARTAARWREAAGATLANALTAVSARPPLGRFGDQAGSVGRRGGSWDDRAELIWGLDFLLEAVAARGAAGAGAT